MLLAVLLFARDSINANTFKLEFHDASNDTDSDTSSRGSLPTRPTRDFLKLFL